MAEIRKKREKLAAGVEGREAERETNR